MIQGIHAIIYSKKAEELRRFLSDELEWRSVDAGEGWLIFALPPAEMGIHPTEEEGHHELFLMCTEINGTVEQLKGKGVKIKSPISDRGWGLVTKLELPSGDEIALYQPKHPTAITLVA